MVVVNVIQNAPSSRAAGGSVGREKNNTEYAENHLHPADNSRNVSRAAHESAPITQTSPDTERGGKQDKIRIDHRQPSPRKMNQEHTERKKTLARKVGKVKK